MKNIVKKVVLIAFIFFYLFYIASAGIVINEVQLSPTEDRFIELFNSGDSTVDLTGWYIQRKTQTGSSFTSLVSNTNFENKKINAKGYFLISRSLMQGADIVISDMTLTDSNVIQIKNKEKEVVDKVCWGSVDDCGALKTSNPTEGQSIQRQNNTLIIGAPTGGKENTSSVVNTNNEQADTNIGSSSSAPSKSTKISQQSIIVEALLKNNVVFAGLGTKFQGKVSRDGEALFYGRYFWNFGDGSSEETKVNTGGKVSHTYFYPGEYALSLEYYVNDYGDPEASDSMIVKVIGADILISAVGSEQDFFIELSNNTDKDVDIGKWMLVSGDKRFVFPKNTIISAKKKIIFSPFVTGFVFSDKNNLKLVNPDWKTVFDYALSVMLAPPAVVVNNSKPKVTVARANVTNSAIAENVTTEFLNQVDASNTAEVSSTNLGAQAISSEVADSYNKGNIYYLILLVLLLAGGGAIYFIQRSNRQNLETTEDFEILDE